MAGASVTSTHWAALGLIASLFTACAHDFSHGRVVMCSFDEYFFVKESDAVALDEFGKLTVHANYGPRLIGQLGAPPFHRFMFASASRPKWYGPQVLQSTGLSSIDGAILYRTADLLLRVSMRDTSSKRTSSSCRTSRIGNARSRSRSPTTPPKRKRRSRWRCFGARGITKTGRASARRSVRVTRAREPNFPAARPPRCPCSGTEEPLTTSVVAT
jgi:hypothetical protein